MAAQFHPDQPYSDPRVRLVNADGRVFLRNTNEKFDLIIFALPDSLTLTSSIANLRLESFLFTQDSLAAARDALAPNGVLVLYNYYREPWLIEKLASMVGRTFGRDSFVSTYGGQGRGAVIINGPRLSEIPAGTFGPYREEAFSPGRQGAARNGRRILCRDRTTRQRRTIGRSFTFRKKSFPDALSSRPGGGPGDFARRDFLGRAARARSGGSTGTCSFSASPSPFWK